MVQRPGTMVMTLTDLVSLDRLTPTVYNAFVSGPYANWVVDNVTMVEFPKWQAIIVIKVGQDNVDIKYQLFYTPQGILLKTRNVVICMIFSGQVPFWQTRN